MAEEKVTSFFTRYHVWNVMDNSTSPKYIKLALPRLPSSGLQ
jgi:hypothetical protein